MHVIHKRLQHGVGQGGFHSAKVEVSRLDDTEYSFDYVYDCGAVAFGKKSPLRQSIQSLKSQLRADGAGQRVINALVLSHFDQDHIVGAKHLVERYDVRRIFLPYLSEQEWMLVLASQADRWRGIEVRALHALATGGGLFGVAVTMVGPTGSPAEQTDVPADQPFPPNGVPVRSTGDRTEALPRPKYLEATTGVNGTALERTLPPGADINLCVPGHVPQQMAWLMRFWNRGVKAELLTHLAAMLEACGFPLAALSEPKGAKSVLEWLGKPGRRDLAVAAYLSAVNATLPVKCKAVSASHIANHISLGLYSGPAQAFNWRGAHYAMRCWDDTGCGEGFWAGRSLCGRKSAQAHECRTGWLGTGDAPLGQADVWEDFEQRYRQQLAQTLSIQVPHHGAAPKTGPAFFNRGLLPASGMNAVLAAGTKNAYGHPDKSVTAAIKKAGGHLQLVSELKQPGFEECLTYWT